MISKNERDRMRVAAHLLGDPGCTVALQLLGELDAAEDKIQQLESQLAVEAGRRDKWEFGPGD